MTPVLLPASAAYDPLRVVEWHLLPIEPDPGPPAYEWAIFPVQPAPPAVGSTLDGGVAWQVLSVRATLTTSAAAGNRSPVLTAWAPTQPALDAYPWLDVASFSQGPSLVRAHHFIPPVPLLLTRNAYASCSTTGLDAGDEWSDLVVCAVLLRGR